MSIFSKKPPITNGNAYNTQENLNAQVNIDYANIENPRNLSKATNRGTIQSLKNSIGGDKSKAKQYIEQRTLQTYFLLQLQANYFCNTIEFECNNNIVTEQIYKIIRGAFINGRAGMYKTITNKLQPVGIMNKIIDSNGNAIEYTLTPIDNVINSQTAPSKNKKITSFRVKDVENVIEFNWGTAALSAWVIMLPFILQQQSLLTMLNTLSFSYLKKYVYKINDPTAINDELELFFDPTNPFIADTGISSGLNNKFSSFDLSSAGGSQKDFIDYYNESIKIWYELFGRRNNKDDKKERNVSGEVKATQEQYNNLQNDYINQFKLFINRLKLSNWIIDLDIKMKDEINEELENDDIRTNTNAGI